MGQPLLSISLEAAEDARKRSVLLSNASEALSSSFEYERTLTQVAALLVPALADGCAIDVVDARDVIRRVVVLHADPAARDLQRRLQAIGPPDPTSTRGIHALLARGESVLVDHFTDEGLEAAARDADHLAVLRALRLRSGVIVPLRARDRSIGAIWLYTTPFSNRELGPRDLATTVDIGRRIQLAVDNAMLYREAQEATRLREDFLSIAGHELNTPLTALKAQVWSLRKLPNGDARIPEKLAVVARQVDRLELLIGQLLDVSRLTAGRLLLDVEPVDLAEVVEENVERHRELLQRSGSTLQVTAARGVATGDWDRVRLEQTVSNLLTNAIKYGRGEPIEIELAADDVHARLRVRDHGIGITPDDQARIFERFERAVPMRHYGGFGLGLWIVRQIVEAMGGTIRVESEANRGSLFTVELPRRT